MSKTSLLSLFSSAALALLVASSAGATTITLGGTSVAGQGMMTSKAGATTTTFNGLSALPAGFTASGTNPANPLVTGSINNVYLTPTGDTSTYLTTGTGVIQDVLSPSTTYFGFYWGSVDTWNTFSITDNSNKVFQFTGTDLSHQFGVTVNGNASYYVNLFADAGKTFTTAGFASSSNSFEFDNVAAATPEPGTAAMLSGGLLILVGSLRRRKKA